MYDNSNIEVVIDDYDNGNCEEEESNDESNRKYDEIKNLKNMVKSVERKNAWLE